MEGAATLLQMVLSLAAVVVVILGLAWMSRRVQGLRAGAGSELRLHASLAVGVKERVLIVEAQGQRYLLGVGPGRVNLLQTLGPAGEAQGADAVAGDGPPPADTPNFRDAFAQQLRQVFGR